MFRGLHRERTPAVALVAAKFHRLRPEKVLEQPRLFPVFLEGIVPPPPKERFGIRVSYREFTSGSDLCGVDETPISSYTGRYVKYLNENLGLGRTNTYNDKHRETLEKVCKFVSRFYCSLVLAHVGVVGAVHFTAKISYQWMRAKLDSSYSQNAWRKNIRSLRKDLLATAGCLVLWTQINYIFRPIIFQEKIS